MRAPFDPEELADGVDFMAAVRAGDRLVSQNADDPLWRRLTRRRARELQAQRDELDAWLTRWRNWAMAGAVPRYELALYAADWWRPTIIEALDCLGRDIVDELVIQTMSAPSGQRRWPILCTLIAREIRNLEDLGIAEYGGS